MKFIAMDTEAGGLTKECSLLTAYFAVLDSNLEIIDELDLKIKPPKNAVEGRGLYVVTAEGLGYNRINIALHDKEAVSFDEAKTQLYDFLHKNSLDGKEKLTPLGHNVAFDVVGIRERGLIRKSVWDHFCSYRVIDTSPIGKFLQMCGKIPDNVKGSLQSYIDFFEVFPETYHTARGDTKMTVDVYKEMMRLITS